MKYAHLVLALLAVLFVGACEQKASAAKYVFEGIDIVSWQETENIITLTLSKDVAQKFNAFTADHKGSKIDIYIGDTLFFSPVINEPSSDEQISFSGLKENDLDKLRKILPADRKK